MKGFTLMELLIVVAIILILATVGLSNFIFSIAKSRDVRRKSDLTAMAKGLEAFANDFGQYPAGNGAGRMVACDLNGAGLVACAYGSPWAAYVGVFPNGAVVTYLDNLPSDPLSTQSYFYERTSTGYNFYAALENVNDPDYQTGLTVSCGTGITCNYQLTASGAK